MQIRTIRKGFDAFEFKFVAFEMDSKNSKVIRSIRMKIRSIGKGLEEIEWKFE